MFAAIIVRNSNRALTSDDCPPSNNLKSNSSCTTHARRILDFLVFPTTSHFTPHPSRLMSGSDLLLQEDDRRSLLRSDPLSSSSSPSPSPSPSPSTLQPLAANATLGTPRSLLSRLHVDRQTSPDPVTEVNAATPRAVLRLSSGGLTRRSLHVDSPRVGPNVTAESPRGAVRDELADGAPPEWALLLIGCLLGLATGVCVAAFNRGVHVIHEWAWAGTPNEGAAWLRLQRLADTWHRILLVPVTGGVIVGMMHGLLEIFEQIRQMRNSQRKTLDLLAAVFPTIKAVQAAVTLGTGCSLGPEGPSVDIGKSCANGCSEMMENNRERRIALLAAGAAAGIASGFNAAVAGCFFAIETVLRPLRAENSPPFTTAMIILASVISSTVSNVLLGEKPAFIVPTYELKSAAELPLYLILGMLCGAVSVVFARLVVWFTKFFDHIKKQFNLPAVVCPALGGLGAGLIALKYPGVLYWGFTNVEEILHTGKSASAPGIWLVAQLAAAKVVATALCKGSGLVGGLYAPSLMIGAAIGAVFGGSAAHVINTAIPGNSAVAQPQAYALVGMAATLASVCSVPLTSVLLLFELTKDYRILLPLMGAVGLAIWVPSVTNWHKGGTLFETGFFRRGYSPLPSLENNGALVKVNGGEEFELVIVQSDVLHDEANDEELLLDDLKVSQAMSKIYVKVKPNITVKEAVKFMQDKHQSCVLVVDGEDFLEGIVTFGDIHRQGLFTPNEVPINGGEAPPIPDGNSLISSCLTRGFQYRGSERGLLTCFQDTDLTTAKELMEAKGIKQLPVVKRGKSQGKNGKRRLIGLLYYDSINRCLREEVERWKAIYQREQEFLHIATNSD